MLAMLAFFILTTPPATDKAVKSRTFLFSYEASLLDLMEKVVARVWIPVPSSTLEQTVEIVALHLPGRSQLECERKYGNRVLYLELAGGANSESKIRIDYRILRREVRTGDEKPTAADEALYLKPDNKVPADGKHLQLLKRKELPENPKALSRALYDLVNSELRYSKLGMGWGQGDVNWVCDSKYGNCTDFHSLFIGLARANKMPGKFEIGFSLPEMRGEGLIPGYHCWAKISPAGCGWLPVDISTANQEPQLQDYCFGNLSEDRVAFSVGRDIHLIPKQAGPPLNFFIYPYVEVNGEPYPSDKIERKFRYKDESAASSSK